MGSEQNNLRFLLTAKWRYAKMRTVMKTYTQDEVVEMVRKRIGNRKQREFASEMGVSQQYLNDILQGRRAPGPSILRYLGLAKAFVSSEVKA